MVSCRTIDLDGMGRSFRVESKSLVEVVADEVRFGFEFGKYSEKLGINSTRQQMQ